MRGPKPSSLKTALLWISSPVGVICSILAVLASAATILNLLLQAGIIRPLHPPASTATAVTPHPTITPSPQETYQMFQSRQPVLTDPLSQNVQGWNVVLGAQYGGSCTFESSELYVLQPSNGAVTTCAAQNIHVTNFAMQAELTINSGFGGGFALRVGQGGYRFDITNGGTADFASTAHGQEDIVTTLWSGEINGGATIGPSQVQTLFIVASSRRFDFWVNGNYLGGVDVFSPPPNVGDLIGVFAYCQGSSKARVAFSNLEVWKD